MLMLLGDCPDDHYQCSDDKCVRMSKACDGNDDCSDGSDEDDGCKGINKEI